MTEDEIRDKTRRCWRMKAMMSKSLRELLQDPRTAQIIQKAITENRKIEDRLIEAVTRVYPTSEELKEVTDRNIKRFKKALTNLAKR